MVVGTGVPCRDPDTHIVIVMNPSFWDDWDIIYSELPEEDRRIPLQLFCGGRSRTESVWNGIMDLPHDAEHTDSRTRCRPASDN